VNISLTLMRGRQSKDKIDPGKQNQHDGNNQDPSEIADTASAMETDSSAKPLAVPSDRPIPGWRYVTILVSMK
jgi:hypothetical protein